MKQQKTKNVWLFFFTGVVSVRVCQAAPTEKMHRPNEHYILFDQVGDLASSVTYLHVALPINLTTFNDQTQLLATTLNALADAGRLKYMDSK